MNLKALGSMAAEAGGAFVEDKGTRMAAALAYYTVFSIAPLLLIAIAIVGLVLGQKNATSEIYTQLRDILGAPYAVAVQSVVEGAYKPATGTVAVIVGFAALLFGASGVFGELQDDMNTIWKAPPPKSGGIWSTVKARFLSFTMVLGAGFLLLVSLVISAALAALGHFINPVMMPDGQIIAQVFNEAFSTAMISVLFGLIFKVMPDVPVAWRDVILGAVFTGVLFTVGKFVLGLYLGRTAATSSYGAAAALAVVLLWTYYSAMILLFGAEFTAVHCRRRVAIQADAAGDKKQHVIGPDAPGTAAAAAKPAAEPHR